jgi:uncharacterized membrane-anchored protein
MVRLIVVITIAGGLAIFLMREVVLGIRTGRIRHTDSRSICSRAKSPVLFWFLVALFSAFSAAAAIGCLRVLQDAMT